MAEKNRKFPEQARSSRYSRDPPPTPPFGRAKGVTFPSLSEPGCGEHSNTPPQVLLQTEPAAQLRGTWPAMNLQLTATSGSHSSA